MSTGTLTDKQALQEGEYRLPYHWLSKRTVRVQYQRTSHLIAGRVRSHLGSGGLVLDAGCGDGRGTADLRELLAEPDFVLCGVDYSQRAILHAKAMTYGSGLRFEVADLTGPLDGLRGSQAFDCVLLREVLEHLTEEDLTAALSCAHQVLCDGGLIVVTVPSANLPVSAKHYRHYTPRLLRDTLTSHGFSMLEVTGFGYAPLYSERLMRLGQQPKVWRVFNPLWREVDPDNACDLLAVGRKREST